MAHTPTPVPLLLSPVVTLTCWASLDVFLRRCAGFRNFGCGPPSPRAHLFSVSLRFSLAISGATGSCSPKGRPAHSAGPRRIWAPAAFFKVCFASFRAPDPGPKWDGLRCPPGLGGSVPHPSPFRRRVLAHKVLRPRSDGHIVFQSPSFSFLAPDPDPQRDGLRIPLALGRSGRRRGAPFPFPARS